jgi:hypothetical protein
MIRVKWFNAEWQVLWLYRQNWFYIINKFGGLDLLAPKLIFTMLRTIWGLPPRKSIEMPIIARIKKNYLPHLHNQRYFNSYLVKWRIKWFICHYRSWKTLKGNMVEEWGSISWQLRDERLWRDHRWRGELFVSSHCTDGRNWTDIQYIWCDG